MRMCGRFGEEYKAAKHTLEQYQQDVDQFRKVIQELDLCTAR